MYIINTFCFQMHVLLSRKSYIPVSNNYLDIYSVNENLCSINFTKNPILSALGKIILPYTNVYDNCPRPFSPVINFYVRFKNIKFIENVLNIFIFLNRVSTMYNIFQHLEKVYHLFGRIVYIDLSLILKVKMKQFFM